MKYAFLLSSHYTSDIRFTDVTEAKDEPVKLIDVSITNHSQTCSRDVAEMVDKDHNNVLKDIRRIIEHLGEVKSYQSSKYFVESTYINAQNKQQPCYLLTKKGCELFSTRMTGAKGTQFAVKYIEY